MARTFSGLEGEVGPGTLVYESFYPQNPGIVRRIVSDKTVPLTDHEGNIYSHRRNIVVEVEWRRETSKRKKVTTANIMGLQSFEALIEEHERKFKKQSAMAEELRKLDV
jgi:hypothetical protein